MPATCQLLHVRRRPARWHPALPPRAAAPAGRGRQVDARERNVGLLTHAAQRHPCTHDLLHGALLTRRQLGHACARAAGAQQRSAAAAGVAARQRTRQRSAASPTSSHGACCTALLLLLRGCCRCGRHVRAPIGARLCTAWPRAPRSHAGARTCGAPDGSRRDAVDADAVLAPLQREAARDAVDRRLGGRRVHLVPGGAVVQRRADVDDRATARRLERVKRGTAHGEGADGVNLHHWRRGAGARRASARQQQRKARRIGRAHGYCVAAAATRTHAAVHACTAPQPPAAFARSPAQRKTHPS